MKVFLDTNIFIRFFVPEDEETHERVRSLIEKCGKGNFLPYTSSFVLLECSFILHRIYGFPDIRVQDCLEKIIAMRNMIVVDRSDTRRALEMWEKTRVKFTDCLIATQVPKGVILVTYDRDFAKLHGIIAKTPKDIVTASEKS